MELGPTCLVTAGAPGAVMVTVAGWPPLLAICPDRTPCWPLALEMITRSFTLTAPKVMFTPSAGW